jgi:hypothetical protein
MMTKYYLRRPSATHKCIYLVSGVEYSEKARPQHPWAGWTYTADELKQMDYKGYEPVEVNK